MSQGAANRAGEQNPPAGFRRRRARVFLVEEDAIVRGWIRCVFEESEFELAGEAASFAEAVGALGAGEAADLLLIDQGLPDGVGTDLVRELRRRGVAAPAIVMATQASSGFNETAREAGAQGSILKTADGNPVLEGLRAVRSGDFSFDRRHPPRPAGQPALSPRERDALRLVAYGATNREIAEALGVSPQTVKTLISRALFKLGVERRVQAVAKARALGLL